MDIFNYISPIRLHPTLLLSLQILISTFTVGYTPARSTWRPAVLPLQLTLIHSIVFSSANYMRPYWASLIGGLSAVNFLQFLDANLISKWSFEHNGPVDWISSEKPGEFPIKVNDTFWSRFLWGFNVNCAWRHINTPQETKNSPHFRPQDPHYEPSRSVFLVRSLLIFICAYMIIDYFSMQPPPQDPATLFGPDRIRFFKRLGDITVEELVFRAIVTFSVNLNSYCLLTGIPLLVSFFFVGLGVSEPRFWRPLFGSLFESYSLRRFWGNFWHQNLRRMLAEPSKFLARRILCLPDGGLLQRYANLVGIFYISGVVHAIADVAGGVISWREQLTVRFFVMQALGIMIEDLVAAIYRAIRCKKRTPESAAFWIKIVGYAWTGGFLVWSVPMWVYPGASKAPPGTRPILPYSVISMEWT